MVSRPALPTSHQFSWLSPCGVSRSSAHHGGPARDSPTVSIAQSILQGALRVAKGPILHPCGAVVVLPGQKVMLFPLAPSLTTPFLLLLQVKPLPSKFSSSCLGGWEG